MSCKTPATSYSFSQIVQWDAYCRWDRCSQIEWISPPTVKHHLALWRKLFVLHWQNSNTWWLRKGYRMSLLFLSFFLPTWQFPNTPTKTTKNLSTIIRVLAQQHLSRELSSFRAAYPPCLQAPQDQTPPGRSQGCAGNLSALRAASCSPLEAVIKQRDRGKNVPAKSSRGTTTWSAKIAKNGA